MAAKLPTESQALDRSRKLPGPGSYKHTEVLGKPYYDWKFLFI